MTGSGNGSDLSKLLSEMPFMSETISDLEGIFSAARLHGRKRPFHSRLLDCQNKYAETLHEKPDDKNLWKRVLNEAKGGIGK